MCCTVSIVLTIIAVKRIVVNLRYFTHERTKEGCKAMITYRNIERLTANG